MWEPDNVLYMASGDVSPVCLLYPDNNCSLHTFSIAKETYFEIHISRLSYSHNMRA